MFGVRVHANLLLLHMFGVRVHAMLLLLPMFGVRVHANLLLLHMFWASNNKIHVHRSHTYTVK
jgi:hypothetical protein